MKNLTGTSGSIKLVLSLTNKPVAININTLVKKATAKQTNFFIAEGFTRLSHN